MIQKIDLDRWTTDWSGFEFENADGRWVCVEKTHNISLGTFTWQCQLIDWQAGGYEGVGAYDEFAELQLVAIYADQQQAYIKELEARIAVLENNDSV